jgi:hypothetical protein
LSPPLAPLYRWQRRLEKAAQAAGGAVAVVKLGAVERRQALSKCDRHGWRRCSDRVADEWVPHGF